MPLNQVSLEVVVAVGTLCAPQGDVTEEHAWLKRQCVGFLPHPWAVDSLSWCGTSVFWMIPIIVAGLWTHLPGPITVLPVSSTLERVGEKSTPAEKAFLRRLISSSVVFVAEFICVGCIWSSVVEGKVHLKDRLCYVNLLKATKFMEK